MPHIEEVRFSSPGHSEETHFRMNKDDTQCWMTEEEHIVKIAHVIQLHYGIPRSLPPKPSSFHFDCFQKSHQVIKCMICVAWDWFAIWMGFVAYLIAKSATLVPSGRPDNSSPALDWYNHLQNKHNFSKAWLDGLLVSTACSFDLGTPCAGIVFQWSEENRQHESIKWFYDHNIPLWFVWSSKEEQAILDNPSLAYLQPPNKLIQQALTILFSIPDVPLAGLILQQYFRIGNDPITNKTIEFLCLQYAPSFVFQFTAKIFLGQGDSLESIRQRSAQESIDADLITLKVCHRFVQEFIDTNLITLKASQERRCQAAAEAASSFPCDDLLMKPQAARKAASPPVEATWGTLSSIKATWGAPSGEDVVSSAWGTPSAWGAPSGEHVASFAWGTSAWGTPCAEDVVSSVWAASWTTATSSSVEFPLALSYLHPSDEEKGKTYNHYNDFFAACEKHQKEMMKVESS